MNQLLWQPSQEAIAASQLTAFTTWIETQFGEQFDSYTDLHAWSVKHPDKFWSSYQTWTDMRTSTPATSPVDNLDQFPGADWFPGQRLNYAENLLVNRSEKTAVISILESGEREETSYATLYLQTAKVARTLADLGVGQGDRVAAWMPNVTATISAMLAASSLGAVWSSCSPDFGAPGALDRFGQIQPKVLFACNGYYYGGKVIDITSKVREVAAQIDSIEQIIWVPILDAAVELQTQESSWVEALEQPDQEVVFTQLPFDHPLYILYSSGTTGKPKCIVHGQGGTLIQHKKEHQLHLDLRAEDRLFFFTTCGWMMWNWVVSALASQCTIILYDGSPLHPSPATMFDIVDQEAITVFGISAKFLSSAEKAGVVPTKSHSLDTMRMLISTGSPLTHEGYNYVYGQVKADCHLVSMSGGTDLISCFMLGNPNLPVYQGELQSPGLGMAVEIWGDDGQRIYGEKGELVCTRPFPSAPIGFWNDPGDAKYRAAYFERFPNIWVHGDWAEETASGGYVIFGRSDAVLNPGGVRIGTAEIYRQVEKFDAIVDAVCVGQQWGDDVRVVLFVVMREDIELTEQLIGDIKLKIRQHASPRHVPAKIVSVADIPRTMSGKIAELAVRDVIHGREVKNTSALANPEALREFIDLQALTD